jgi:hypothetical protein
MLVEQPLVDEGREIGAARGRKLEAVLVGLREALIGTSAAKDKKRAGP